MARGELSSFVGRKVQIRQLKELVRARRLVTLVGVGGVGKTRLATRVATELARYFAAGFWYVDLASVNEAGLLAQAASAVGIVEAPTTPVLLALAERFRGGRCLLVLDNCEHLIEAAASVATELLQACPSLTILATSREPFRCDGEHVYQVPPLEVPALDEQPSLGHVARTEAGQLFLERAAAAADFRADDHTAADVAALCQRLDGIPLALELAAALLRTLNLYQVVERSADALHILSAGNRLAPRRQQTLEAAIDWSYQLLSPRERRIFEHLAVFAGSMSLEAVEAVCEDIPRDAVLPILSALVDKSLVVAEPAIEPGPRFRLLETVRQFARGRLDKRGRHAVEKRHATYFLGLAEKSAARRRQSKRHYWQDQLA
jgi:non-specific serine/threonine protein kinase